MATISLNTLDALVVVLDIKGRIVHFNKACEKLTGYSLEEVQDKEVEDLLLVQQEKEQAKALSSELNAGHFPNKVENYWKTKKGNLRRIAWSNTCLLDSEGAVEYIIGTGIDITERHKVEKALQESEKRFRQLAENIKEIFWVLETKESKLIYISPAIENILGFPRESFLLRAKSWVKIIHPADRHQIKLAKEKILQGEDVIFACRIVGSFGTIRWINSRAFPVRNRQNEIYRIVGISEDITDRKRIEAALQKAYDELEVRVQERTSELLKANEQLKREIAEHQRTEKALRESEEKFRAQYKGTPVPTYTWQKIGEDFILIDFNEAAKHITHGKIADLLQKTAKQVYHGKSGIIDDIHQCFSEKKTFYREMIYQYLTTDEIKNLIFHYVYVPPDLVMIHTVDMTNWKQAEAALRESQARFKAIFEKAAIGIVLASPDGKLLQSNPAFQRMCGYSDDELRKMAFAETTHPEDVGKSKKLYQELLAGDRDYFEIEKRYFRKDGQVFWGRLTVSVVCSDEGKLLFIIGLIEDITKHKQAERAQRASERLAATGRMAARIAHEISNPLASIKNSFQLIKDAIPKNHPYYDYVGKIDQEIDRLARIIHQMHEVYHPDQEIVRKFNIQQTIRDVIDLLNTKCLEEEIRITTELPESSVRVIQPEDYLRQILFNILQNAIDASPRPGEIHVSLKVNQDDLIISVADQGEGIPEHIASQIFEPFFTTKNKKGGKGFGLGLAISRSLVQSMGGILTHSARADQRKGTEFKINLPLSNIITRKGNDE